MNHHAAYNSDSIIVKLVMIKLIHYYILYNKKIAACSEHINVVNGTGELTNYSLFSWTTIIRKIINGIGKFHNVFMAK